MGMSYEKKKIAGTSTKEKLDAAYEAIASLYEANATLTAKVEALTTAANTAGGTETK